MRFPDKWPAASVHDCITTGSSVTNIIWLIGATGSFKMTESINSEHVFLHIFTVDSIKTDFSFEIE